MVKTKAKKRVLSALNESLDNDAFFDKMIVYEKSTTEDVKLLNMEQTKRRKLIQTHFSPIITSHPIIRKLFNGSIEPTINDAEFSMCVTSKTDYRPIINCIQISYDDLKDSWALAHTSDKVDQKCTHEYYWTLTTDCKLSVIERWLENPELLNEIAQRVQSKLCTMQEEAKKSFLLAAQKIEQVNQVNSLEVDQPNSNV